MSTSPRFDPFDSLSPLEYRYANKDLARFLSENAFIRYKLAAEVALVQTLRKRGLCPASAAKEIEKACGKVTAGEVYAEEARVKHDIRALVNCIVMVQ